MYKRQGLSKEAFDQATVTILSEPAVDVTYTELPQVEGNRVFAIESVSYTHLDVYKRQGFTVVEWGGTEVV